LAHKSQNLEVNLSFSVWTHIIPKSPSSAHLSSPLSTPLHSFEELPLTLRSPLLTMSSPSVPSSIISTENFA